MSSEILIGLILVIAGLGALLLIRRTPGKPRPRRAARPVSPINDRHYWGVTLVVPDGEECCQAVRDLQGQEFQKNQAPTLPLPDCTVHNCHCRYQYVSERRHGRDRRSGAERRKTVRFETDNHDRRSGNDRRSATRIWTDPHD